MSQDQYERILENRRSEALVIMSEAKKHYRQAVANFKTADRDLVSWREEQGGKHGVHSAQENNGTRDTV